MKKIIYTTDYSENSVPALKYAIALGRLLGDDVIALHVYDPHEENEAGENSIKQEIRKRHQDKLLAFCKQHLGKDYNTSDLSVAAIKGADVPVAISDFVRDMNVNMIVMGACGTTTLKEVFVGSTTKEMLEVSPFPVLAVPRDFTTGNLKKVIFASILDDEDIEHLAELVQMIQAVEPEIKVIHVTHKEPEPAKEALDSFKERVQNRISYQNISFESVYSNHVYDTLKNTIEENKPDVVVMPEHKEKFGVDKMIMRDRIKKMQSCTGVPLLSFPSHK